MDLLLKTITQSPSLLDAWGYAFIIQLTIYFGICGGVVVSVLALKRLKIGSVLDERPLKQHQIRSEILSSLGSSLIYAVYMLACFRLASGIHPSSFFEGLVQLIAFLAIYDIANYTTHRLLHTGRFRRFHHQHHRSVRVTPWSTSSLHPVEAILSQIPLLLFVWFVPVSSLMIIVFYAVLMLFMAMGHSNYSPVSHTFNAPKLKGYIRFHQRHHQLGHVNYGFLGIHWDLVFGTHFQEEKDSSKTG